MKIIISESQYKLILENEKYLGQIMELIETFDETNIDMAFQIAKGLKIKQSTILEHYEELFKLFKYKPSVINLKKIIKKTVLNVYDNLSKTTIDLIFKLPNLKIIYFYTLNDGDLDDLVSTNKRLYFSSHCKITSIPNLKEVGTLGLLGSKITSIPNLTSVGELYNVHSKITSLPKLKEVEYDLTLSATDIESLPNLISVGGNLSLIETPLGESLKSKMSKDEIKNKFGVKGNLYL
jgi:hypothetical protein